MVQLVRENNTLNLVDYCNKLHWTQAKLAREADVDAHTVSKAIHGKLIMNTPAQKIAAALSKALGKTIQPGDIEGMNYR